jgi:hypothetical protein
MIRTASIRRLKRSPEPGMNYRYAVRIPGFERRILVTTKDDALRAFRHSPVNPVNPVNKVPTP